MKTKQEEEQGFVTSTSTIVVCEKTRKGSNPMSSILVKYV